MRLFAGLSLVIALAACGGAKAQGPIAKPATEAPTRPYGLYLPDVQGPVPLVVVLHGYSIDGVREVRMLRLEALARAKGFALAFPDGTKDAKGYRFWNATDACCNWFRSPVDDSAFLASMIEEIARTHAIDAKRVFVVGHSNGAFMAHRFACEHADKVAAIATLAGVPWKDEARCTPREPVSVLHMQGTADPFILPAGGRIEQNPPYPSTDETVRLWAKKNGCPLAEPAQAGRLFDFDRAVPGAETMKSTYGSCAGGSSVELWTLRGSGHEPEVSDEFAEAIYGFLAAHPKP